MGLEGEDLVLRGRREGAKGGRRGGVKSGEG